MESPTALADDQGSLLVASLDSDLRKNLGIFLTPEPIARYMASRLHLAQDLVRILDPAAGSGVLTCALIERLVLSPTPPKTIDVVAYELHSEIHQQLSLVLEVAADWALKRGVRVKIETHCKDYIENYASRPLFELEDGQFDLVIANPPYFKLSSKDHRYLRLASLIPSQPNIYSMFMTLSARELRPNGEMVFIIPRSFASGIYFRPFRQWFFSQMRLLEIHVFDSRRQAFKRDAVLQENIILHARRSEGGFEATSVILSHSEGIEDLSQPKLWESSLVDLLEPRSQDFLLRLPSSPSDLKLIRAMDALPETLSSLGLSISTGPVVAFRSWDSILDEPEQATVPLLWLNHVRHGHVAWPVDGRTGQYLLTTDSKLKVKMQNLVLLRRFSAKDEARRLTASALIASDYPYPSIGLENHLNYIYRKGHPLTADEARGLSAILNSQIMDRYFRSVSGNTQVGASELRNIPLPPLNEIARIGQKEATKSSDELAVVQVLTGAYDDSVGVVAD